MTEKKNKYQMVYDEFLYLATMNLAGADGSDCSFEGRLKGNELTADQEYSLVNTMCILTNARPSGDVSHNAVKQMFTAFKYIKNENLQNMMIERIADAASQNSSGKPPILDMAKWMLSYVETSQDLRISREITSIALNLAEKTGDWEEQGGAEVTKLALTTAKTLTGKEITQSLKGKEKTDKVRIEWLPDPKPSPR